MKHIIKVNIHKCYYISLDISFWHFPPVVDRYIPFTNDVDRGHSILSRVVSSDAISAGRHDGRPRRKKLPSRQLSTLATVPSRNEISLIGKLPP